MAQTAGGQHKLEQPVGIVLGAQKVMLRTPLQNTPIEAAAGMVLFAGDTLENNAKGTIEFVLCRDRKKRGVSDGGKATIGTDGASGSVEGTESVAFCLLPLVDRQPVASEQQTDEDLPVPPAGETLDDRMLALPDQERQQFVAAYNPVIQALQRHSDDLTARIARAVTLEKFKLNLDASDEYHSIWDQWPGAVWAREKARETAPPKSDAEAGPGRTYALVVGVSKYEFNKQGVDNLNYTAADAQTFAGFLEQPRGGSLHPVSQGGDDLTFLAEQEATPDAIRDGMESVLAKAKSNDTAVLFFTGHGAVAATGIDAATKKTSYEGFVLTYHSNPDDLGSSALSMGDIRSKILAHLGHVKRVLLYIDVCHAAQIGVIEDASRINEMVLVVLGTRPNKLGIFMASRANELAFEAKEYGGGHGAFTYFLIRALNGDADQPPSGNGDGIVTANEMLKYVETNVEKATRDNQHPQDSVFLLDAKQPLSDTKVSPGVDLTSWSVPPAAFFRGSKYRVLSADLGGAKGTAGGPEPEAGGAEDLARRFDQALEKGRLRADEPDNASAALEGLRRQAGPLAQEQVRVLESRLLVALENRGQSTVLQYLKGDQEGLKEQQFLDAASDFETALRLSPGAQFDDSRAKFCRGRALIYEKKYTDAVTLLEQAIRLDPTRAYAYNALGIAYLEQVDRDIHYYDYATAAFQDAINRAPYWAYPRHNLALALTQKGEFQRAAVEYRAAMDVGPHYSYLPYNLGLLYQQIADFPMAKSYYKTAEKVADQRCQLRMGKGFQACPERSLPRTGLAALEIRQGNRKKARNLLEDARADDSENLTAAHDEAAILADWHGHESEAATLWAGNLQRDPKHLPSLIGYSELLNRECQFAKAAPLYRGVLDQLPQYVPAQIGLAQALVGIGQLDEAGRLTEELVEQRPTNAEAWAARAEFLARSGGESAGAWAKARQYAKDGAQRKQIEQQRKGGCALKQQPNH